VIQGGPSAKDRRKAEELFQHYCTAMSANGLHPAGQLDPFQINQIAETLDAKAVSLHEFKEVIDFAIKHWELLCAYDSDGSRLQPEANFYQIIAPWRVKKWYDLSKTGFEKKAEERKKKVDIKEFDRRKNLEMWEGFSLWNKTK
jgi:hypothetical protein